MDNIANIVKSEERHTVYLKISIDGLTSHYSKPYGLQFIQQLEGNPDLECVSPKFKVSHQKDLNPSFAFSFINCKYAMFHWFSDFKIVFLTSSGIEETYHVSNDALNIEVDLTPENEDLCHEFYQLYQYEHTAAPSFHSSGELSIKVPITLPLWLPSKIKGIFGTFELSFVPNEDAKLKWKIENEFSLLTTKVMEEEVTINCGNEVFVFNKQRLSSISAVFQSLLRAEKGVITLQESPEDLAALDAIVNGKATKNLFTNSLLAFAKRYQIEGLISLCKQEIVSHTTSGDE